MFHRLASFVVVVTCCGCTPAVPTGSKPVAPRSASKAAGDLHETEPFYAHSPSVKQQPTAKSPAAGEAAAHSEFVRLAQQSPQKNDFFGAAVAIDGHRVVVGCGGDDSGGSDTGSAYVFERHAAADWRLVAKLNGAGIKNHLRFGYAVAVQGDLVAVGAERDELFSGAVYIFEKSATGEWNQTARLKPSDSHRNQLFGVRVAISGEWLLVGAQQDMIGGNDAGAAYVFQRDAKTGWRQAAKLISNDLRKNDQLGAAVAISGTTAVVGSRHNDDNTGSAYVYQPDEGGKWRQVGKLKAEPTTIAGQFGISVAVDGKTVLVGEWRHDVRGRKVGAAYLFEADKQNEWRMVQKITAHDPRERDYCFGYAVALRQNRALVGTFVLVAGDQYGAAYLFQRGEDGRWHQSARLSVAGESRSGQFGTALALSDQRAVVGDEATGRTYGEGAAYVFTLPPQSGKGQ
jgi:hypothetical protein